MKSIKDIIALILSIGSLCGAVGGYFVMQYKVDQLQVQVGKLTTERDALIIVETQQNEIIKRLDKQDEKNEKIYNLIIGLSE